MSIPARFVSQPMFEANLVRQMEMSPRTLDQLRGHGVTDTTRLRLEFFFYTNTSAKAVALADDLATNGYDVEHGDAVDEKDMFVITGWREVCFDPNQHLIEIRYY